MTGAPVGSASSNAPPPPLLLAIHGPLSRDDLPGLTARVCASLAAARPASVLCQVAGVADDAVAVDALARLQLAAQRYGCRVRLLGASAQLCSLIELMGLSDVVAG
ncbi:MAG: STAS domain-containing protein [Candidatus Dormibacteria bacterium]